DFVAAGARRMHIVDLDAARGRPDASTEMAVRRAVWAACEDGCAVQVGGGVRTPQDTGRWLEEGAAFVVLGSLAVRDPELTRQICQTYEGKVLLALDVRDGDARISGWTEPGGAMEDVLRSWRGRPCAGVVFMGAGRVVKGVNFVDLRDAGEPAELAARYDQDGAGELVFLDITASSDARSILLDAVRRTADQVFIPVTVGGGIRGLGDIDALLRAGADKVSLNTAALERPGLIGDAAARFGEQCIVVAIDARRDGDGYA